MNRRVFALALAASALLAGAALARPTASAPAKKRVLIITQAAGFKHSSIPVAAATVKELGEKSGAWEVVGQAGTAEEVAAAITAENLKNVDLVFFANTTGNLGFTPEGKKAFYDWIRNGGAYAGVHSAGDTFHGDADYLDLVRGEFQTHGPQVKVQITVQDPNHPACKGFPSSFEMFDEIYEFKNWDRAKVHVLLTMHKHPQRDEQGDFPVAWTNRLGKGRMFYTSLGHREEMYANDLYRQHLTGGIKWALGLEKGDDKPGNPLR
jgi:type 1 glutamine amidotransferase